MAWVYRGPGVNDRALHLGARTDLALYHEASLSCVRVGRGRQASTRAVARSSPWQAMRSRHHQGGSWHRHLQGGISWTTAGGEIPRDAVHRRKAYVVNKGGQQLGRTRYRERHGSTGRAGRSKAGERLAIRLCIKGLLFCHSLGHFRHQPHRHGEIAII